MSNLGDRPTEGEQLAQLRERARRGEALRYLPFWGHTPRYPDSIDASCLSQWFEAPFELDSELYATTEHYMMAEKARLFADEDARRAVLAAKHPAEAKKLGRTVRGFDDAAWRRVRFDVVLRGNLAKFGTNEPLRRFLLNTGDQILVEASPQDAIWGVGFAREDERLTQPANWPGLNLLGFALMHVREFLTSEPTRASSA